MSTINRTNVRVTTSLAIIAMLSVNATAAAATTSNVSVEMRYKVECENEVVRLGDVANVFCDDSAQAQRLRAVELMTTPRLGVRHDLTIRELQDKLEMRGENMNHYRFSGLAECIVSRARPVVERTAAKKPERIVSKRSMSSADIDRIEEHAGKVITQYLSYAVSGDNPWMVTTKLRMEVAREIFEADRVTDVKGGQSPWFGQQRFELTLSTIDPQTEQPLRFWVDAEVDRPVRVVVAARAMNRGHRIVASDMTTVEVAASKAAGDTFRSIEEVVGLEVTTSIPLNRQITTRHAKAQRLVRSGNAVTLICRAPGITVTRKNLRAKQDGAMGELITVQSQDKDRTELLARVCGPLQVEMFASRQTGHSASSYTPSGESRGMQVVNTSHPRPASDATATPRYQSVLGSPMQQQPYTQPQYAQQPYAQQQPQAQPQYKAPGVNTLSYAVGSQSAGYGRPIAPAPSGTLSQPAGIAVPVNVRAASNGPLGYNPYTGR